MSSPLRTFPNCVCIAFLPCLFLGAHRRRAAKISVSFNVRTSCVLSAWGTAKSGTEGSSYFENALFLSNVYLVHIYATCSIDAVLCFACNVYVFMHCVMSVTARISPYDLFRQLSYPIYIYTHILCI